MTPSYAAKTPGEAPDCDVLVVGGGPAGLAAAIELRRMGAGRVVVAERERAFGGIARHSVHTGYGLRDLHRVMGGPRYAAHYTDLAERAGVELRSSTTVMDLARDQAELYSPTGPSILSPRAVLLATGTRERPRSARLIPGERPAGVYTTGALQQLAQAGRFRGSRAVIVGAEHVSFSAVLTLAHAGCSTVALVTPEPRHQTFVALAFVTAGLRRVPLMRGVEVVEIVGRDRVTGVVIARPGGPHQELACDTVVVTGDWVPDHELARRSGLAIDPGTRAPTVDSMLRLARPGWFAAGNLLHGAETADVCALDGRHVARGVVQWLGDPDPARWPVGQVPLDVAPPLRWISPNRVRPGERPPRDRFLLRVGARSSAIGAPAGSAMTEADPSPRRWLLASHRHLVIRQGDRELWAGRPGGVLEPHRSCWVPARWVDQLEPHDVPNGPGTPVRVELA